MKVLELKSKDGSGTLCHMIIRYTDFQCLKNKRIDVIPSDNFLQLSALSLDKGRTFDPHIHIEKEGPEVIIAQESWVVIEGSVMVTYFDNNKEFYGNYILEPGDVSITLRGGHTYTILEDNTMVYEFKSGPYTGIENDKEFI